MVSLYQQDHGFWIIGCGRCGCHSGINKDKDILVDSWNHRPTEEDALRFGVRYGFNQGCYEPETSDEAWMEYRK